MLVSRWSEPFANLGGLLITSTMPRIKKLGVQILARAHLREIGDHWVRVYDIDTGAETVLEVEAIVMATGRPADLSLGRELAGRAEQVFSIGDALSPPRADRRHQDGHRFARTVGEPDAPRTFTDLYLARDEDWYRMLSVTAPIWPGSADGGRKWRFCARRRFSGVSNW